MKTRRSDVARLGAVVPSLDSVSACGDTREEADGQTREAILGPFASNVGGRISDAA